MNVYACQPRPNFPIKQPKVVKKVRKMQKKRDAQVKTIMTDITSIATQEVDRLRDIMHEMIVDETSENPIIIYEERDQDDDDE